MISLDLTWTIILFGAVATYTAQHFSLLARGLHRHPPVQAAWVGLATLALIARRFNGGEPPLSREALADRMCLPTTELERILRPLAIQGPLELVGDHGYALTADPRQIRVEDVLAAYDHRARRGAELVNGEIAAHLQTLIGDLAGIRARTLADLTVAGLLEAAPVTEDPGKTRPCPAGPPGYNTALQHRGAVAQLGEHHVRNVGVEGSNPFCSTIYLPSFPPGRPLAAARMVPLSKACLPNRTNRAFQV